MRRRCTEKLVSQAWSAYGGVFERMQRPLSQANDSGGEDFADADAFLSNVEGEGLLEASKSSADDAGSAGEDGLSGDILSGALEGMGIVSLDQFLLGSERRVIGLPHDAREMAKTSIC